jgi:hypothetical protein
MKKAEEQQSESGLMIDTTPIRLSAEETRVILRCAVAGKPIRDTNHNFMVLEQLGILRRIEISEEEETDAKIVECWERASKGMWGKDSDTVHQAMHDLERLAMDRDRNERQYLYELSETGQQLAQNITVRMHSQFAGVKP